jgi:hypothetical protein
MLGVSRSEKPTGYINQSIPTLRMPVGQPGQPRGRIRVDRQSGMANVSFAELHFYGIGCRKLPVPVWLGARGTRVEFTNFSGRCSTGGATHR